MTRHPLHSWKYPSGTCVLSWKPGLTVATASTAYYPPTPRITYGRNSHRDPCGRGRERLSVGAAARGGSPVHTPVWERAKLVREEEP